MKKVGLMPKKMFQKSFARANEGDVESMYRMFVLFVSEDVNLDKAEYWLLKLLAKEDMQAIHIYEEFQKTGDLVSAYENCRIS